MYSEKLNLKVYRDENYAKKNLPATFGNNGGILSGHLDSILGIGEENIDNIDVIIHLIDNFHDNCCFATEIIYAFDNEYFFAIIGEHTAQKYKLTEQFIKDLISDITDINVPLEKSKSKYEMIDQLRQKIKD